jgi:hypothetical protein
MVKNKISGFIRLLVLALVLFLNFFEVRAQSSPLQSPSLPKNYPWSESDLIQPSALASEINHPKTHPLLIFNIGVAGNIKGSRNFGGVSELNNLEEFKKVLKKLPLNTSFVYYCGCCPFERCPNIRPAYKLVKEMGFTQAKLLNLNTNLKTDWMAMKYPMD